jgi:hypothetical protein
MSKILEQRSNHGERGGYSEPPFLSSFAVLAVV